MPEPSDIAIWLVDMVNKERPEVVMYKAEDRVERKRGGVEFLF